MRRIGKAAGEGDLRDTLPERDRQKAMQMPAIDIMDYIKSIEES